MKNVIRMIAVAAALSLSFGAAEAQHHGGYRGGHWGPGPFWGGIGLGVGLGLGAYYAYGAPWYPDYAYAAPPPYVVQPPVVVYNTPAAPPAPAPRGPDPIFYPRNGQTPQQVEADRQDCNRWATTQPSAMADASVFQRAALACMDGRGYSSR